jgi:hypothetical protein
VGSEARPSSSLPGSSQARPPPNIRYAYDLAVAAVELHDPSRFSYEDGIWTDCGDRASSNASP